MNQSQARISWIDIATFVVAALLPLFFVFMLWYGNHAAVSYLADIQPPEDLSFGTLLWLLPISIIGVLTFSLWGALDRHATRFTSRVVAGFAALGLVYYLLLFFREGLGIIGQFESFILLPLGDELLNLTRIPGGQAFLPILLLLLFLFGQAFIKRDVPEERTEEAPRALGLPLPVFSGVFFVANAVLFLILANWGSLLAGGGDVLTFIFNPGDRVDEVVVCSESAGCSFWHPVIFTVLLLAIVITGFAYTTLLERKVLGWLQSRVGPNRVGPGGLLQPAADGLKLIFKENILPSQVDKGVYRVAPILKALPTLVVLGVIPFGPDIMIPWFDGNWYQIPLVLADPGVGILWLLAITSIGTYGVVLAGWSSNNKYSMIGGLRAASQMVSYELSMAITLAVPVLIAGSMSIVNIVADQGGLFLNWFIFQNPLAAIILMIALIAETNRAPFDLPEAEQELTGGYLTEYSGMKFALFMMAEYLGMIAMSMIAATVFLGGYNDGFGLVDSLPILGPLVMFGKTVLFLFGFVWIRGTLPRIRYDRLMSFGWKIMLPLALLSVVWTAVAVIVGEELGTTAYAITSVLMFVLLFAGSVFFLGRPEKAEDMEYETDPVITGEDRGIVQALVVVTGGLFSMIFALYKVIAPVVVFLWRIVTVPILALLNVGNNRTRFRKGLLAVVDPVARLGSGEEDAPRLGSGGD